MLLPFKENNLFGMVNEKGQVVIGPVYEKLSEFVEGYALGRFNAKWLYIDQSGNSMKSFNVDQMGLFHEGMARINIHGCIGFINKEFEVLIEPKYGLDSSIFKQEYALVSTPKKYEKKLYGFIDKYGQETIDMKYEFAMDFNEDLAAVNMNDKWGAIDKEGKLIIDFKYDWINYFNEERAFFIKGDSWGIIDNKGNEIVTGRLKNNEEHYEYQNFSEGYAVINNEFKSAYINRYGVNVTDFIYDEACALKGGHAAVKVNDKWGFLDKDFNMVTDFVYEEVDGFMEGLAAVKCEGKWGFINSRGELAVGTKYEEVGRFKNGIVLTVLNGRLGYINSKGQEIFRARHTYKEPYQYLFI